MAFENAVTGQCAGQTPRPISHAVDKADTAARSCGVDLRVGSNYVNPLSLRTQGNTLVNRVLTP